MFKIQREGEIKNTPYDWSSKIISRNNDGSHFVEFRGPSISQLTNSNADIFPINSIAEGEVIAVNNVGKKHLLVVETHKRMFIEYTGLVSDSVAMVPKRGEVVKAGQCLGTVVRYSQEENPKFLIKASTLEGKIIELGKLFRDIDKERGIDFSLKEVQEIYGVVEREVNKGLQEYYAHLDSDAVADLRSIEKQKIMQMLLGFFAVKRRKLFGAL